MKEILAALGLAAITSLTKPEILKAMDKFNKNNTIELYTDFIKAGYFFFKCLTDLTKKSKTNLDDAIAGMFIDACVEHAEANGVEL